MKQRSDCPISSTLDIIGDKWSLLIVRDIIMNGKNTYNEFLKSAEKIATNVLADRLAMLEATGILTKEKHPDSKAKIYYKLTNKGIDLLPIIIELTLWADEYLPVSKDAIAYGKLLKKDKAAITKQAMTALKKNNK